MEKFFLMSFILNKWKNIFSTCFQLGPSLNQFFCQFSLIFRYTMAEKYEIEIIYYKEIYDKIKEKF